MTFSFPLFVFISCLFPFSFLFLDCSFVPFLFIFPFSYIMSLFLFSFSLLSSYSIALYVFSCSFFPLSSFILVFFLFHVISLCLIFSHVFYVPLHFPFVFFILFPSFSLFFFFYASCPSFLAVSFLALLSLSLYVTSEHQSINTLVLHKCLNAFGLRYRHWILIKLGSNTHKHGWQPCMSSRRHGCHLLTGARCQARSH